jgi:hypothetical protein
MIRQLTIKTILFLFAFVSYGQCPEVFPNLSFLKISKNIDLSKVDTLLNGENVTVPYIKLRKNGSMEFTGSLNITRTNGNFIYKQVGDWYTYVDNIIFTKAHFDDCGNLKHELYFQNLDTVKTGELNTFPVLINGKTYIVEESVFYSGNTIYKQSFLLFKKRQRKYGIWSKTINGVIVKEKKY